MYFVKNEVYVKYFSPQALCRAEDEEDIVAASQAKAEQVAELAEFNESIPFEEAGEAVAREQQQQQQEEEELSKAEQEIAAVVEQVIYSVCRISGSSLHCTN